MAVKQGSREHCPRQAEFRTKFSNVNLSETEFEKLRSQGKSPEDVVSLLRKNGHSKVETINVLVRVFGLPVLEAKKMVHFSGCWADTKDQDEQLHALLEKSLRKLKELP